MQGTIKKLLAEKKCGFISQEGAEKDAFFNEENLDGIKYEDLKEGDTVTFEVKEGEKGPSAINVKKA